jgi:hypothetical protein
MMVNAKYLILLLLFHWYGKAVAAAAFPVCQNWQLLPTQSQSPDFILQQTPHFIFTDNINSTLKTVLQLI